MSQAQELYQSGVELYDRGDHEGAGWMFDQALAIDPNSAYAHNGRGAILYLSGKRDEALAEFNRAIELDPTFAKPYIGRGTILATQGKIEEAFADFARAMELNPELFEIYLNRGELHKHLNNITAAEADFEIALKLAPDTNRGRFNKAGCLLRLDRLEEAIRVFSQCVERNYSVARSIGSRGIAKYRQRKFEEAARDFEIALTIDPNIAWVHAYRAELQKSYYDQRVEAIRSYEQALRIEPNNVGYRCELAWLLQEQREFTQALKHLEAAEKFSPSNGFIFAGQANCYIEMGRSARAVYALSRCIEEGYYVAWSYGKRAKAHAMQGFWKESLADCEASLALEPNNLRVQSDLRKALCELFYFDRAKAFCNELIERNPNEAWHFINRGKVYICTYDLPNALSDFSQAIALAPTNVSAYRMRATVYESMWEFEKAIADLKEATRIRPNKRTESWLDQLRQKRLDNPRNNT